MRTRRCPECETMHAGNAPWCDKCLPVVRERTRARPSGMLKPKPGTEDHSKTHWLRGQGSRAEEPNPSFENVVREYEDGAS